MIPAVAGAIVPVYNLKDTDGKVITTTVNFPHTALADIYLGKIKKWDDPVLTKANPDLKLPAKDIAVVRRSDGSGTTFAYTDYLSQVSAEWKDKVGSASSVKWPVEGIGGKGNEGVAAMTGLNDGAIGYVEFAYAKQNALVYGAVQNKAGTYQTQHPSCASCNGRFWHEYGRQARALNRERARQDSWPMRPTPTCSSTWIKLIASRVKRW
jgi:phosphate transport system substrate-binding protein